MEILMKEYRTVNLLEFRLIVKWLIEMMGMT